MRKQIKETRARLLMNQKVRVRKYGANIVMQTVNDPVYSESGTSPYSNGAEYRGQNTSSIKRSMRMIRELIAENFDGDAGIGGYFITLTFADDEIGSDLAQIYQVQRKFMQRLKYRIKTIFDRDDIMYLTVIEPQPIRSSRAGKFIWHFHMLIKLADNAPLLLTNTFVSDAWGMGRTDVQTLENYGSISSYLATYLSTINVKNDEHKAIKASRLPLYPAGIRIYRASRNLKRPSVYEFDTKEEALRAFGLSENDVDFVKTYDWSDNFIQGRFTSEYYKID